MAPARVRLERGLSIRLFAVCNDSHSAAKSSGYSDREAKDYWRSNGVDLLTLFVGLQPQVMLLEFFRSAQQGCLAHNQTPNLLHAVQLVRRGQRRFQQ